MFFDIETLIEIQRLQASEAAGCTLRDTLRHQWLETRFTQQRGRSPEAVQNLAL